MNESDDNQPIQLTFDQGKERQARWKKLCKEDWLALDNRYEVTDKDLLNWLSMNFNISRKIIKTQVI